MTFLTTSPGRAGYVTRNTFHMDVLELSARAANHLFWENETHNETRIDAIDQRHNK